MHADWIGGVMGGGAEKEGKVFMRGGAEGKAKLEIESLIKRVIKKSVYTFYIVDPVLGGMWPK